MKPVLLLSLFTLFATTANAHTKGAQQLSYGYILVIVTMIAAYSAKLVADRQKERKKIR